jgi:hypothetical protein
VKRSKYRKRQRFYDFEELFPLSHFEVDLKEIYDTKTLSKEAIEHGERLKIPPYQWTAIDVKTRMRFLCYSYEKTFTNGLIFMLMVIYFLRSKGITREIVLQTDNGSEFGGVSVDKLEYLNKAIFSVLNAKLVHIPKGKKEFNAYVERSHQTDDNEFYIPQLQRCESLKEFMYRALRWEWFYNTKREHSMIKSTPYDYLKKFVSIDKSVGLFPVIILDNVIDILDTILPVPPGHNVSANDLIRTTQHILLSFRRVQNRVTAALQSPAFLLFFPLHQGIAHCFGDPVYTWLIPMIDSPAVHTDIFPSN